jgi:hypothetical protein
MLVEALFPAGPEEPAEAVGAGKTVERTFPEAGTDAPLGPGVLAVDPDELFGGNGAEPTGRAEVFAALFEASALEDRSPTDAPT